VIINHLGTDGASGQIAETRDAVTAPPYPPSRVFVVYDGDGGCSHVCRDTEKPASPARHRDLRRTATWGFERSARDLPVCTPTPLGYRDRVGHTPSSSPSGDDLAGRMRYGEAVSCPGP